MLKVDSFMSDVGKTTPPNLPRFKRTLQQLEQVERHRVTARLIRSLWEAASPSQASNSEIILQLEEQFCVFPILAFPDLIVV